MSDVFLATFIGLLFGMSFGYFHLPIPAPPTIAGVMGVVGVTIGYMFIRNFV